MNSNQLEPASSSCETYPLSVVILAKNEALNITRCVKSVAWCDDVVVIDDGSTDGTRELAEQAGARVIQNRFQSFAKQRNWALDNAQLKHPWVLMLDADETSTEEFQQDILRQIQMADESVAAFRTCRKTILGDTWLKYSDEFPCWIMRIVRRDRARFEDSGHGEVPIPMVQGTIGTVTAPFVHYPFSRGLSDWFVRHVKYAEREAKLEVAQQAEIRWSDLTSRQPGQRRRFLRSLSRRMPFRPMLRFAYQYFFRRGFLDGRPGLIFSSMKSVYEAMIVIKRWELTHLSPSDTHPADPPAK